MRFHFGVSFRFKYLKKFLFPILLGILSYFCINYFNIASVNALTNLNTNYTFTLNRIEFENMNMFGDMTYQQFLDNVISNYNQTEKNIYVDFEYNNNVYHIYVYLINTNNSISTNFRGQNATRNSSFVMSHTVSGYGYYDFVGSSMNSTDSTLYNQFISCLNSYSNCQNTTNLTDGVNSFTKGNHNRLTYIGLNLTTTFNNDDSFDLGVLDNYGYIYYSNLSFVANPDTNDSSTNKFYKNINLTANNTLYSISSQDTVPTYYDLFHNITPEPEPEPEPEPVPETSINVPFSRFVYWFGEYDSVEEILVNIYCLLFIFLFGFMFLKVINIVRGVKW